jgi:hypothetical protein
MDLWRHPMKQGRPLARFQTEAAIGEPIGVASLRNSPDEYCSVWSVERSDSRG